MPMQQIPWVPQQARGRSSALDAQVCINYFGEQAPAKDAESDVIMIGAPGLTEWVNLPPGPIRGFHIVNDLLYVVSGPNLYSVSQGGVTALCGMGISGSAVVQIADNGQQIVIVNGVAGYLYQISTNTLTVIGQNSVVPVTVSVAATPDQNQINVTVSTGVVVPAAITGLGMAPGTTVTNVVGNLLTLSNTTTEPIPVGTILTCTVEGTNVFYPATTVTFMDGYFVFERTGTAEFFWSNLYEGGQYNGLDYATKESNSDFLRAVINLHELLILVGERTMEMWYDAGQIDAPFAPYTSSLVQRGTAAGKTVIIEDNSIFFLGDDLIMYRFQSYLPTRVSTHVEESAWAAYGSYLDAFCMSVVWQGHKFIVVTFPSAPEGSPRSWAYDIATQLWHIRDSLDAENLSMSRWRANTSIIYFGRTLIGDVVTGQVGVWDYDAWTEYGNTMMGQVSSPPIHKDRRRIFMAGFEVLMESGTGLSEGQGSNPQIFLDWSDDGGRTWSARRLPAAIGPMGAYKTRTRWLRLGQSRTRTLRLTVTDPVRRNIIGAYLNLSAGES